MATGRDHLFRRGSVYWWRRRLPAPIGRQVGVASLARSLGTRDPALAQRRARACSVHFDRAMLRLMTAERAPTRQELADILDELFRRVLDDGERNRAMRPSGPPPWTPDPQGGDPRYEGAENWDDVDYPPELWQQEAAEAVMMNAQEDVADMVGDALDLRDLRLPRNRPEWRLFCRLALIAVSQAQAVNARREWGDYSDGWPDGAGIPDRLLPLMAGTEGMEAPAQTAASRSAAVTHKSAAARPEAAPRFSDMFRAFIDDRGAGLDDQRGTAWTVNTTRQANIALEKFVSLIGDLPVDRITSDTAEKLRGRLKEMPNLWGRTVYAGMSAEQALMKAKRLRRDIAANSERVLLNGKPVPLEQAQRWAEPVTLKTVNRDLTFFTTFGKWMAKSSIRKRWLHEQVSPFSGSLFTKRELKVNARARGKKRTIFTPEQIAALLSAPLMQAQPAFAKRSDFTALFREAQYWSVIIGLYTGLRLGEIAQLYPTDIKQKNGIWYIDLVEDAQRSFKTEAGERQVPLHPQLVKLGLPVLAEKAAKAGRKKLFEGMVADPIKKQEGANISKWFLRFRRSCGVPGSETPFHSLRHTFAQALREAHSGQDILIDQIMGHEPGSVGAMHYAESLTLEKKAAAVAAVRYGV